MFFTIPLKFNKPDVSQTRYMFILTVSTCLPINKLASRGSEIDKNDATTWVPNPDMPEPKMETNLLFSNHSLCILNK